MIVRLLAVCLFVLSAALAQAQQLPQGELVRARLVAEHQSVQPGQIAWVAVQLAMRPGWHVYFRNPGDAGLPTTIEWSLPGGWRAGDIAWPRPIRFETGGLASFGYKDAVALLVPLHVPTDAQAGAELTAQVSWLACEVVCIPGDAHVQLTLPVAASSPALDPDAIALFSATRARLPAATGFVARAEIQGERLTLTMPVVPIYGVGGVNATFVPDDSSLIDHAAPQPLARDGESFTLTLRRNPTGPTDIEIITGTLLVDGRIDGRAVERGYAVQANVAAVSLAVPDLMPNSPAIGWWEAILFALLGGVVLNAMPCVFPVLSLKIASLAGHGAQSRMRVVRDGVAYAAGVLAAVAALAIVLLALRAGGMAIGWGFQLQSPVFVAILTYVLFLMGLSLSGVVQFGGALASVGSGFAARSGVAGSFLTGVLATVVATPCTGPFMGTALGVAATAPLLDAFAIVMALGLGLALPFLLVCVVPGLARLLPRPGRWMDVLKQALAFPLYASAAWLMWVLAQQVDSAGLAFAFGGLIFVAFAAWLWRQVQESEGRDRVIARVFAITASIGVIATLSPIGAAPPPARAAAVQTGPIAWENFTSARLDELMRAGRPVLLNMTASWCLTCLVNERNAIETEAVRDALLRRGVVALKGDWTNRNAEIAETLARFGRSGVPLTIVFPGNGRAPIMLPELMSQATLLAALGAER